MVTHPSPSQKLGFLLFCCSLLFRIVRYNPLFLGILVSTVIRNGVNFVRPGELRQARWKDVDLDGAEWRLPVEDTKLTLEEKARQQGQVHVIPLSRQAVEVLRELHPFTGRSQYVFPGRASSRVLSPNTINSALRTMRWDSDTVCGHGFRTTARTMLHETLNFSPDAIEAQLGHRVPDRLGAAYNRTKHLEERRRMMQAWADYLDGLKRTSV